jgi:hypothetical protein
MTNSLCVHYVAHHRSEVPANRLARIEAFAFEEVEPSEQELQGPDVVLLRARTRVQRRLGTDRLRTWKRWGLDVEKLARGLRGGCLPARQGLSHARVDAEDLLTLLGSIRAESLSGLQTVVEQDHGTELLDRQEPAAAGRGALPPARGAPRRDRRRAGAGPLGSLGDGPPAGQRGRRRPGQCCARVRSLRARPGPGGHGWGPGVAAWGNKEALSAPVGSRRTYTDVTQKGHKGTFL